MMCSVVRGETRPSNTRRTSQGVAVTSSSTGARRFDGPSLKMRLRSAGIASGVSDGCQMSQFIAGAKCTACWPVPLPISSTCVQPAKASRNTSSIGPLLRSQASERADNGGSIARCASGEGQGPGDRDQPHPASPATIAIMPARRGQRPLAQIAPMPAPCETDECASTSVGRRRVGEGRERDAADQRGMLASTDQFCMWRRQP